MRLRVWAAVLAAAGCLTGIPATALATGSGTRSASRGGSTTATATTPSPATTGGSTSVTPTATTPTATTPTSTATTPTPTVGRPAPARVRARLYLHGLVTIKRDAVTVPHRAVEVTGVVTPYVSGQRVLVQAFIGRHPFRQTLITLRPSKHRIYGGFRLDVAAPAAGPLTVRVTHAANTAMRGFVVGRRYSVLSERVHVGSTGRFVQLLQARLAARHIYIRQTGVFDLGTELALDTYHRLLGGGEGHTAPTAATVTDLLNGVGTFRVRFRHQGYHAEGDLADQVLAYINGDRVQYLLPISSGKPSTPTILGSFQVYRKQPGFLPDGMYYSNFFIRGYAIHGYDPAPDHPASHGCMRLPMVDAIFAYGLLNVGDWVDTYAR